MLGLLLSFLGWYGGLQPEQRSLAALLFAGFNPS